MPLYDYSCPGCGQSFEKRVPIAEADQTSCPRCGSQQTKRQLPHIALQIQNVSSIPLSASDGTCSTGSCCGGMCGLGDIN
jgi:putative FmdB family regulatory protein